VLYDRELRMEKNLSILSALGLSLFKDNILQNLHIIIFH